MLRSALRWLAVVFVGSAIVPTTAPGQFGQGMGGMVPNPTLSQRMAEVESGAGNQVKGPLKLAPVTIDSEFGRYEIAPENLRAIRFDFQENTEPHMVMMPGQSLIEVPGTLVARSGEEIAGQISIFYPLTMTTPLGTLTLSPGKLRSITFLDEPGEGGAAPLEAPPAEPDAEPQPPAEAPAAGFVPAEPYTVDPAGSSALQSSRPDQTQAWDDGSALWAISPTGDRIVVKHKRTGKTKTLRLPASEDAPLSVTPISNGIVTALELKGPKLSRLAVYSQADWHPIDLREPVSKKASPVVHAEAAAYTLGRFVYAFSARAGRWDVLELPEGTSPSPSVQSDSITVDQGGTIHTFDYQTGLWTSINLAELLEAGDDDDEDAKPAPEPDDEPESP